MKYLLLCLTLLFTHLLSANPKVLHLTWHNGCKKEVEYIAEKLGIDLETWYIPEVPVDEFDGQTSGNARYNISHEVAENIWKVNKEWFNEFDLIITSDTAALARIFLQNPWQKPLIVWVCNRFDYCDKCSLNCHFPDPEFYNLFRSTTSRKNVAVISYTEFEHVYAKKFHAVNAWNKTIKPVGALKTWELNVSNIPSEVDKPNTFFIPPYHNDTYFIDLTKQLTRLGIPCYRGRYSGPLDLQDFKGIIHIPYAWSNLALFENIANGLIYFVPSMKFLLQIYKSGSFYWTPPFDVESLHYSEWYAPDNAPLFVYFDSWADLVKKIETTDYEQKREAIKAFQKKHEEKMLRSWRKVFGDLLRETFNGV